MSDEIIRHVTLLNGIPVPSDHPLYHHPDTKPL